MPTKENDCIEAANPKSFALPLGKTALLIIDMQRDFVAKGGYGMYQCPSPATFSNVSFITSTLKEVLDETREKGIVVIHTREGHERDLRDCAVTKRVRQRANNPEKHSLCIGEKGPMGRLLVRGEYGHDIIDELKPLSNEVIVDKPGKGSFFNTSLYQILTSRGITHLVLAGVTTECCVSSTLREANDRGFECCVITDCTSGFDTEITNASKRLFSLYDGLFGYSCNSNDYLTTLKNGPNYSGIQRSSCADEPLSGYRFYITEKVSGTSYVVERLRFKGAHMIGSIKTPESFTPQKKVFLIDLDTNGQIHTNNQAGCIFSPTFGTVPITDSAPACPSFDKLALFALDSKDIRAVWVELLVTNHADPYFRPRRCFPTPPINPYGLFDNFSVGLLGQKNAIPQLELFLKRVELYAEIKLLNLRQFREGNMLGKILQDQERGILKFSAGAGSGIRKDDKRTVTATEAALLRFKLLRITKDVAKPFEFNRVHVIFAPKTPEIMEMINTLDLCAMSSLKLDFVLLTGAGFDWRILDLAEVLHI